MNIEQRAKDVPNPQPSRRYQLSQTWRLVPLPLTYELRFEPQLGHSHKLLGYLGFVNNGEQTVSITKRRYIQVS